MKSDSQIREEAFKREASARKPTPYACMAGTPGSRKCA
jgi:hypothetical protein